MGVTGTFTGKEGLRPGNDTIHNRIQDRLFGPVGSNSGSCAKKLNIKSSKVITLSDIQPINYG